MPIVGLDSIRNRGDGDDEEKKRNEYYSGGVNSQGGGRQITKILFNHSGLAVVGGNGDQ